MKSQISLQMNLSGGDVAYAATTVPRLVAGHRSVVQEVFAVVDCCRPQATQMISPADKFPEPGFSDRVQVISGIAESLKSAGVLDRVVYIRPGAARTRELQRRYVGWIVTETHDCYGCGLVSYLYGLDETRTRYVLHYDADMLLHQAVGYDWAADAVQHLEAEPRAIAATPRVSPPFAGRLGRKDAPSLHESNVVVEDGPAFWLLGCSVRGATCSTGSALPPGCRSFPSSSLATSLK